MRFSLLVPHINWVASPGALRDVARQPRRWGSRGSRSPITSTTRATTSRPGPGRRSRVATHARCTSRSRRSPSSRASPPRIRLLPTVTGGAPAGPILAAKQLATIDALSEGRLIVGVGVGRPTRSYTDAALVNERHRTNAEQQYKAYGVSRNRSRLMDEITRGVDRHLDRGPGHLPAPT
ncbi:MAG: LLM class flavin-dependent oxidoreductase [Chloroflexota bacterium]